MGLVLGEHRMHVGKAGRAIGVCAAAFRSLWSDVSDVFGMCSNHRDFVRVHFVCSSK